MRALLLLRTLITTKLGACAFCIRVSLLSSLLSWAVFIVLSRFLPESAAATLALLPALGFTTLFASHLAAYAARVVLAYRRAGRVSTGVTAPSPQDRRRFLVLSAQTMGLALVPTLLASKLLGSLAQGPDCPFPPGCDPTVNPCCCDHCRTLLKKCDPNYLLCVGTCAVRCPVVPF